MLKRTIDRGTGAAGVGADPQTPVNAWRRVTLYRVGMLGIIAALTAFSLDMQADADVAGLFLLVLLGVIFTAIHWRGRFRAQPAMVLAEWVAAATIAVLHPSEPALVLYLLAPAVWAGSVLRLLPALVISLLGSTPIIFAFASATDDGGAVRAVVGTLLPACVVLGVYRITQIEAERAQPDHEYDHVLSLLNQLTPATRRLPQGLERHTLVKHAAHDLANSTPGAEIAVCLKSDSAWLVQHGTLPMDAAAQPGSKTWEGAARSGRIHRSGWDRTGAAGWALIPMRRGRVTVGMIVMQVPTGEISQSDSISAQRAAAALALRLEVSDVFAQIRDEGMSEERARMSRQIHDGVAQDLAGLAYLLDGMAADTANRDQQRVVGSAACEVRRLVEELRYSIFDLRTSVGGDQELGAAVASYLQQWSDRSNLRINVQIEDASNTPIAPGTAEELLRIVQEAVTNIRRHAAATTMWVVLRISDDSVLVRISDDGVGLHDTPRARSGHGVGMAIMAERAQRIGAALDFSPRPGGGTIMECRQSRPVLEPARALGDNPDPEPSRHARAGHPLRFRLLAPAAGRRRSGVNGAVGSARA